MNGYSGAPCWECGAEPCRCVTVDSEYLQKLRADADKAEAKMVALIQAVPDDFIRISENRWRAWSRDSDEDYFGDTPGEALAAFADGERVAVLRIRAAATGGEGATDAE